MNHYPFCVIQPSEVHQYERVYMAVDFADPTSTPMLFVLRQESPPQESPPPAKRGSLLKDRVLVYGDKDHAKCGRAIQKLIRIIKEYECELGIKMEGE